MALDSMVASDALWELLQQVAALKPDGTPKDKEDGPTGDFPSGFADAYDTYAQDGEVPGAENEGGDKSILEDFLNGGGPFDVTAFAVALAEYWETVAVEPGVPAHGGIDVVSVENNAMGQVANFEAAIQASITDQESKPYYNEFIKNIEDIALSTVIWTVVEMMPTTPPSPSPWPENII